MIESGWGGSGALVTQAWLLQSACCSCVNTNGQHASRERHLSAAQLLSCLSAAPRWLQENHTLILITSET